MLGELVRQAREDKGLSQEDLARESGLRQEHISAIETGKTRVPRDHNLDALGKVLGLSRSDFYRAAGMLEGLDVGVAAVPVPLDEDDRRFDPAQIVAYVESKPDEEFQAGLARQKARRTAESYRRLCLRIYRAWTSNADLVMGELEAAEREN